MEQDLYDKWIDLYYVLIDGLLQMYVCIHDLFNMFNTTMHSITQCRQLVMPIK